MITRISVATIAFVASGALHVGVLGLWPLDHARARTSSIGQLVVIDSSDALFGEALTPISSLESMTPDSRPTMVEPGGSMLPAGENPLARPTPATSRAKDASIDQGQPQSPLPRKSGLIPIPVDKLGRFDVKPLSVAVAGQRLELSAEPADSVEGVPTADMLRFITSAPESRLVDKVLDARPEGGTHLPFIAAATDLPRSVPGVAASAAAPTVLFGENDLMAPARAGAPIALFKDADEAVTTPASPAVGVSIAVADLSSAPLPTPPVDDVERRSTDHPESLTRVLPLPAVALPGGPPLANAGAVDPMAEALLPSSTYRVWSPGSELPAGGAEADALSEPIASSEERRALPARESADIPRVIAIGHYRVPDAIMPLLYEAAVEPLAEIRPKDIPLPARPPKKSADEAVHSVSGGLNRYSQEIRAEVARAGRHTDRLRAANGTAVVAAVISLDGTLLETRLAASSGHDILDRIAIDRVRKAAPFAPVPVSAEYRAVLIRVPITFGKRSPRG